MAKRTIENCSIIKYKTTVWAMKRPETQVLSDGTLRCGGFPIIPGSDKPIADCKWCKLHVSHDDEAEEIRGMK